MAKSHDNEKLTDILRKALYLGAGTLVYTQEGMAKAVSENLKIPKEAAALLVTQFDRGKKDLIDSVSTLLSSYLTSLDIVDLAHRSLHGLEVDVKLKIRYPGMDDSAENSAD